MTTAATYRIDAPGAGLELHDWGGAGDPVLLAHPTGFHGRVWAPVAEQLVAAGRRVWSFDFRGHGDSDAPAVDADGYSWHGFADDVLAVAAHLGLAGDARLVAGGHSKGGTALLLAEAKRPGTFGRLWTYEPIILDRAGSEAPDADFFLARVTRRRRNEWSSLDEAYAAYAAKPPLNVLTPESLRAYVDYGLRDRGDGTFELKCRPEVEARVYEMGPTHGAWSVLPSITAAVVVGCGAVSESVTPRLAARIAERLPHGRLEVFAGLGHFGPQQDPSSCAESLLAM